MNLKNSFPVILTGFFILSGCAPMQSERGPTLEERIALQDRQLRQIQPQQADTWNQVQAMRQELNDLKGQMDDLKNAGGARALVDKVRQHDTALRQVDDNMALNLNLGDPMQNRGIQISQSGTSPAMQSGIAPQSLPTGGLPPQHAPDSSAYGAASTAQPVSPVISQTQPVPVATAQQTSPATGSYGLPPDNTLTSNIPQPVVAPTESTWGKADPQPEPTQTPKKDISLALFDAGVNAYNARKYDEAERSFKDFVKNYKGHTQSAEAQYYLADCDFQRNKFPQAALGYENVIKNYPKSSSAPKAYLKQAISFGKMNEKAAARARMQELIKKYPNSPEVARARSFLKANK